MCLSKSAENLAKSIDEGSPLAVLLVYTPVIQTTA